MSHGRSMIAVVLLIPTVIASALWAFLWPNARLEPRDLPLGVAGPAQATAPVKTQLERHDGAFEVHTYADEDAARTAIEERDIYGAVVVTRQGPQLLTASAAGPAVAQLLTDAVGGQDGRPVPAKDVVPLPKEDARGTALGSSVLPMALAGIAIGGAVTALGLRGTRAATAVLGAATTIGLVAAGIAHSWLGALAGNWWAEAGAFALVVLAGGATVAGLAALLGTGGIGLGSLLVMLLGNPFSGVSTAPELLPEPAATLGQLLPPGAGGQLLRSVAYFDGNAVGGPLLTLGVWALLGLSLIRLGEPVKRRRTTGGPEPAGGVRPASSVA
ncbi:ABC transporter permease [Streptomyces sp. TRM43335]|uniref:ABC transporter permease n=1 Tax=Streptomyces taklimakanensis TaxID=2569853 RepID=A0A6G2BJH5_9ACTN|nr:ABC transporter permease [Streptomyces taklimakanensis]MTE22437.1 ABC transporter permease [Streptomyces taklimakanensis]